MHEPVSDQRASLLVCAECGAVSDEKARGWRAYQTDDDDVPEDFGPSDIEIFCPSCSQREFDGP